MKAISLLLAFVVCISAQASINSSGRVFSNNPQFIPERFTANNKAALYISESDEFTILDENFNEVSKFSAPTYQEVTAEYRRYNPLTGPLGVSVSSTYDNPSPWGEISTREEFANQCVQNGFSIIKEVSRETWYLPNDRENCYYFDIYGDKYPETIYIWDNSTNYGYVRNYNYTYESWGDTGLYGEPEIEQDDATPRPCDIYPMSSSCVEYENFIISQTLFNNDEAFEWIVPILEAVDYSFTNEYCKEEGKKIRSTGFRIESQNGSVITSIKFPSGMYGYTYVEPYLYMMNNKNYLFIELSNIDNSEYYYMAYEIDNSNASINAVDAPRHLKVAPTMPQRGTNVDITFDKPTENSCKIIVTSVSGKIVLIKNVEAGKMNTSINTDRFEKGMFIVSVHDGKSSHENTKIIVR